MNKLTHTVRIIGGRWRSRRLHFSNLTGLRPTQDRIRETLFNWLAPHLPGANCLDLFAGTGALGFEALSRGAPYTCFVDNQREALADLEKNAFSLGVNPEQFRVIRGDFPYHMPILPGHPFKIIFLDPPFGKNLLEPCIEWLHASIYWQPGSWIYIEREINNPLSLPSGWEIYREQKTKRLIYQLVKCGGSSPDPLYSH